MAKDDHAGVCDDYGQKAASTGPAADPLGFEGMDTIPDTRLQLIPSGAIDSNVVPLWTSTGQSEPGQTKIQKVDLLCNING